MTHFKHSTALASMYAKAHWRLQRLVEILEIVGKWEPLNELVVQELNASRIALAELSGEEVRAWSLGPSPELAVLPGGRGDDGGSVA